MKGASKASRHEGRSNRQRVSSIPAPQGAGFPGTVNRVTLLRKQVHVTLWSHFRHPVYSAQKSGPLPRPERPNDHGARAILLTLGSRGFASALVHPSRSPSGFPERPVRGRPAPSGSSDRPVPRSSPPSGSPEPPVWWRPVTRPTMGRAPAGGETCAAAAPRDANRLGTRTGSRESPDANSLTRTHAKRLAATPRTVAQLLVSRPRAAPRHANSRQPTPPTGKDTRHPNCRTATAINAIATSTPSPTRATFAHEMGLVPMTTSDCCPCTTAR